MQLICALLILFVYNLPELLPFFSRAQGDALLSGDGATEGLLEPEITIRNLATLRNRKLPQCC